MKYDAISQDEYLLNSNLLDVQSIEELEFMRKIYIVHMCEKCV